MNTPGTLWLVGGAALMATVAPWQVMVGLASVIMVAIGVVRRWP